MRNKVLAATAVATALAALLAAPSAQATPVTAVAAPFPLPQGVAGGVAAFVSDNGRTVAGHLRTEPGESVLWRGGRLIRLGADANVRAMNGAGWSTGNVADRAVLFSPTGAATPIAAPEPVVSSQGLAVNRRREVLLGWAAVGQPGKFAVAKRNGSLVRLTPPPGPVPGSVSISPEFLNDRGEVAGTANVFTGTETVQFPFSCRADGICAELPEPTGLPEGDGEFRLTVEGMNNSGEVVGSGSVLVAGGSFGALGVRWTNGVPTVLRAPEGDLQAFISTGPKTINDRGDVVGTSRTGQGAARATLWRRGAPASLLTTPEGVGTSAYLVADNGDVLGTSGYNALTLWTRGTAIPLPPVDGLPNAVPGDLSENRVVVGHSWGFTPSGYTTEPTRWQVG
ncbi:hypothetical protein [Actinokineospora spheciospongiae]|uniref:hypothetical protein n=1 Tax=Actinokineospora spheciospongiae TaxID=909613 RepID=UPI000D70C79C|nr:hypothetical protein [Actinokineospora spheciospongiae]PWW63476.1 hypothetical protein DFQ13_104468 [Actinokineospora spheciospongiae]